MILTYLGHTDITEIEPGLANYIRSGQTNYRVLINEAKDILVRDVKNRGKELKKLCTPLTLTDATKSDQDKIERTRLVIKTTAASNNPTFILQGTDDTSSETYSTVINTFSIPSMAELMPNKVDRDFSGASAWANVDLNAYDAETDLTVTASAKNQYCTLPVASAPTSIESDYSMTVLVANIVGIWELQSYDGTQVIGTISANGTATLTWTAETTGGYRLVAKSENSSGDFDDFTLSLATQIIHKEFEDTYDYYKLTKTGTCTFTAFLVERSFDLPHLYLTLALIYRELNELNDDVYASKADYYIDKYYESLDRAIYSYDATNDGTVSSDDLNTSRTVFTR